MYEVKYSLKHCFIKKKKFCYNPNTSIVGTLLNQIIHTTLGGKTSVFQRWLVMGKV